MTSLLVNGAPRDVADDTTVAALVRTLDVPAEARGVAVAVDAEVIPRGEWERTVLADGAQVEVVTAVQGG